MAQTNVGVTPGTGKNIDGFATAGGNMRQTVVLGDPSTDANVVSVSAGGALKVDNSGVTQPVSGTVTITPSGTQAISATALPLPTGASTAAKQPALGTAGTASTDVLTVQGIASMTALKVDASATTQPVSAAALPLPALAATSTKQSDGTQKTQVVDGSGNVIGATSNALDVNIKSGASSGAVAQGSTTSGQTGGLTQAAVTTSAPTYTTAQTSPLSLTTAGGLRVDGSGTTQPISASALPLPTGAATAAKQPALGTAGSASADVISIQGVASMTALKVDGSGVTQPVSGTVTVNALPAGTNLIGKVGIDQTTVGTTNGVSLAQVGANTVLTGNGASGTGAQRVNISNDNTAIANWGQGATGAALPSGAISNGGLAKTALPTAATDGNLTAMMTDKFGRPITVPVTIRDLVGTQTTTLSASTSETTIVTAGGAGIFDDLIMLIVSNTSAATNTRIDFRDTTAGSILFSLFSIGGAAPVGFALPVPIPQTTANTNWTAQCATSTTDVRIYAVFAKQK